MIISEVWPRSGQPIDLSCDHRPHWPKFEAAVCAGWPPERIRETYPRFDGTCSLCQQRVRIYASQDHGEMLGWQ